jgi:two-component system CheB/CheR fusion protein
MPQHRFLAKLLPEAARLLRVVHELSFARDLEAITAITGAAARELTGADGVSFVLKESDHCYYADENAIAPLWKGLRFPLDTCISGWVMAHNAPAVVPDIYLDSRVPHEAYRPTFVKSLAMVPVCAPEPIAAIGAYWKETHVPTDDEVGSMILLADSAALALANVQLYDDLAASLNREKDARMAAEAAIAAKDDFLALVAHELRQPLHASLAALQVLAARINGESGDRARAVIERQIVQMSRLVDDLLDAARVVKGHVELDVEAVDLRHAIDHAVDAVKPLLEERRHELAVSLPKHPVTVMADMARLQQVFSNLLTNAAKYTEPGGRIGITVGNGDRRATITVVDTGRGIDAAALPRIFELFTRGASDVSGFGVGLAVARRLVELHGGSIEARSAGAGLGAEFTLSLPLATVTT